MLKTGQTINTNFCCQQLARLQKVIERIDRKRGALSFATMQATCTLIVSNRQLLDDVLRALKILADANNHPKHAACIHPHAHVLFFYLAEVTVSVLFTAGVA